VSSSSKVLVVGPSWVGDMVMAQSLFKLLLEQDGEANIDVIAPPWSLQLLARMPEVRSAFELNVAHGELGLGKRLKLGRSLRANRYDRAIVLPRSLKAALVPYAAEIPVRTGWRGEWRFGLINDMRVLNRNVLDQTVKRFLALGARVSESPVTHIPLPALKIDVENLHRLLVSNGLRMDVPVVALMPGAEYGPAKCWPVQNYTELARRLAELGAHVWIFGSAKEFAIGRSICEGATSPGVHNLCGKTALVDAVDLLSATNAAVTNDSGLMHVAAAVGTHVIALYGSSTPDYTPPLTAAKTVFYERLECSPCFERHCPLGHLNCLHAITVDSVLDCLLEHGLVDAGAHTSQNGPVSVGNGGAG